MTLPPSAASIVAQDKRKRRNRRRLIIGIGAPVVLLAFGFFGLPPIVKSQAIKHLSAELHRDVAIERIRINPLVLSATIEGLEIKDRDGGAFTSWKSLYVDFDSFSLFTGEWRFQKIALAGFAQRVAIAKDGAFNFADLIPAASPETTASATPAKPARPIRIAELTVTGAAFDFSDASRAAPFATQVGPLSFDLQNFVTAGDPKAPYAFSAVTESGEKFAWKGTVSITPVRSSGRFSLGGIALKKYAPYYAPFSNADLLDGLLDVEATYVVDLSEKSPRLSLAEGRVELSRLAVAVRGQTTPLVTLPSLVVEGIEADGLKPSASIARIALEGGRVQVVREADGSLNLLKLLPTPASPAVPAPTVSVRATPIPASVSTSTPPAPAASAALPDVKVGVVSVAGLAIDIDDSTTPKPARTVIERLDVSVEKFSLTEPSAPLALKLAVALAPGGLIETEGLAIREPLSADLAIKVTSLPLANATPYVEPFMNLRIASGAVSVNGRAALANDTATFKGDVSVEKLSTVDGALGEDFVKFTSLNILGIDAVSSPLALKVTEIALVDPLARLAVNADKTTNLSTILRAGAPASPTVQLPAVGGSTSAPAAPAAPPPAWSLDKFTLVNGAFVLADRSVKPAVRLALDNFSGVVSSLSSDAPQRADVALRGKVNGGGSISITGKIDSRALTPTPDAATEIAFLVKDIDLSPIGPYVGTYAGYELTRGGLSMDVKTKLSQRKIDSTNVVTIKQFTFGAPTNNPLATKLPVRLGVALLKDTSGNILLDPPVSGSIDDPEFKVGRIILRVITNLLAKAATSPFSLIGAAFGGGGDELSFQEFAPGETAPQAEEAAKLETLRKALKNRPALNLDITGSYDAERDLAALRERTLQRQIRFRLWEELRAKDPSTPPPAELTVSPEDEKRIVGLFVAERYPDGQPAPDAEGKVPPPPPLILPMTTVAPAASASKTAAAKPRVVYSHRARREYASPPLATAKAPEKTAPVAPVVFADTPASGAAGGAPALTLEAARAALLASIPVPDEEVRQLADERARKVREALLAGGGVDEGRLFVSPPAAESKGAKVFLQLR